MSEAEQDIADILNELVRACHANSVAHGFHDKPTNYGEKIALVHSELSELLEAIRYNRHIENDEHCSNFSNTEIELADVCIRTFDLAGLMGARLGEAILAKHAYNKTRPHKHGKQF